MQAAEKKRPREEREILHRLRPFARLQTAADYEAFSVDIVCEHFQERNLVFVLTVGRRSSSSQTDTGASTISAAGPLYSC